MCDHIFAVSFRFPVLASIDQLNSSLFRIQYLCASGFAVMEQEFPYPFFVDIKLALAM